jgi:hypothetical protein
MEVLRWSCVADRWAAFSAWSHSWFVLVHSGEYLNPDEASP